MTTYRCPTLRRHLLEHHARAALLLELGRAAEDDKSRYRLHMAALHFACAIGDHMYSNAEREVGREKRAEVHAFLATQVQHFKLVEAVRIHDFHRHAFRPPESGRETIGTHGPIELISRQRKIVAIVGVGPEAVAVKPGNCDIRPDRPLYTRNDEFFDEESGAWVPVALVVQQYLDTIRPCIDILAPAPSTAE